VRSLLLAGCLTLLSCAADSQQTSLRVPQVTLDRAPSRTTPATPRQPAASSQEVPGLDLLALAIAQNAEPELWVDAGESAIAARQEMAAARLDGTNPSLDAAWATADALLAWRAMLEYGALAGSVQPDTAALWTAARAALQQGVITMLSVSLGHHPQTDEVLVDVLFRSRQAQRATQELGAALHRWPAHPPLHALARTWSDAIPDPGVLVTQLEAQFASRDAEIAGFAEQALATQGILSLSWGLRVQEAGDPSEAARLYEAGAEALSRAAGPGQTMDSWELASRRADCLVNAGWLRFAEAKSAIESDGLDTALATLRQAEQDFVGALMEVPEDAGATQGVDFTGDLYYQAGSLEGIRDYFGRIAPQFENPEWWNNHAFFCRETGEYETSYASYQQCIALAPDNPRWVNDTGLILLYHLDRDLDLAEEYFRRSWSLGVEICENPFVSDDKYEDAFLGYTDAMHNLSLLLARRGDLQQAVEVNAELLEIAPGRPDATQLRVELEQALAESAASDAGSLK